jgi:Matrixin
MRRPDTSAWPHSTMLLLLVLGLSLAFSLSAPSDASSEMRLYYDESEEEQGFSTTTPWKSPALTYGFLNGTTDITGTAAQQAVRDAMEQWAMVSKVTFTENTANPSLAQVRVSWGTGEHGHFGNPFDGKSSCFTEKGAVLAHAAFPEDGDIHFDDDEVWTTSEVPCESIDLATVALHEVGHSLGLKHVGDPGSVMYGGYIGTRRYLDIDDILGVQSLYGYSTGLFHLRFENTSGPPSSTFRYGTVLGSRSVIGDWDGDGDQTVGIFHPPEKDFYLRNSNNPGAAEIEFEWGASEDLPVAGDWDGDGDQTIGVFRPSNGKFYLNDSNSGDPADYEFQFGTSGDIPVAGDWNGDGKDSVGVYRPSKKTFFLKNKNSGSESDYTFEYGTITSLLPIVGDWDDDGDVTIGVYNPADGDWYLRNSNNAGAAEIELEYGDGGDVNPISGDWDGDGRTTVGLYQNG